MSKRSHKQDVKSKSNDCFTPNNFDKTVINSVTVKRHNFADMS